MNRISYMYVCHNTARYANRHHATRLQVPTGSLQIYSGKLKMSTTCTITYSQDRQGPVVIWWTLHLSTFIQLTYLILPVLLHTVPPSKSFGGICLGLMLGQLSLVIPSNSTLQTTMKNSFNFGKVSHSEIHILNMSNVTIE